MSETELKTADIPRSSGNTFVVFSSSYDNPAIRLAPTLTAETGLASVVGSLNSDKISIAWNGNNWEVKCFAISSYGQYSFKVTATSNGGDTMESAVSEFTFHVLLLHSDQLVNVLNYELQVGDKLQTPINLPAVNPVLSYGVWHGGLAVPGADPEEQYPSGITLSLRYDSGSEIDIPWIEGTAKRPGLYVGAVHCATDDALIKADGSNPAGVFSGGTDIFAPVILSIRDRDFERGQLMCICDNSVGFNENTVRLIYVNDVLFKEKGDCFCLPMNGSGSWFARHEELVGYTTTVTQVDEYIIELSKEIWELKHRRYIEEDIQEEGGIYPDYTTISTVEKLVDSSLPPSAGWSNGVVVTGDTRLFVPEFGLFDYKGESKGYSLYQQQTIHTRQYLGWKLPPKYTDAEGYILTQRLIADEEKWVIFTKSDRTNIVAIVDTPLPVSGSVIPYAPPSTEKYGTVAIRDLSLGLQNINQAGGALQVASKNSAGGIFAWPDERRALVPYNGTNGDVIQSFSGVTAIISRENFIERGEQWEITWIEGAADYAKGVEEEKNSRGIKLTWTLNEKDLHLSQRTGSHFDWLMILDSAEVKVEHTADGKYKSESVNGVYVGSPGSAPAIYHSDTGTGKMTILSQNVIKSELPSCLTFFIAGGGDHELNKRHQPYVLLKWFGGGASANYTDQFIYEYTVTPYPSMESYTETHTQEYGESITFNPNEFTFVPTRLDLSKVRLSIGEQTVIREEGVFEAKVRKYTETYNEEDYSVDSTAVDIWYDINMKVIREYTTAGDRVVGNTASATWTRSEVLPGFYEGILPVEKTSGTIPSDDNPNANPFEELRKMIDTVKEDLKKCQWPTAALYGAYASGRWEYSGVKNTFTIKSEK